MVQVRILRVITLVLGAAFCSVSQTTSRHVIPKDLLITLERTECFGPCPLYKLTVGANGEVIFEGRRYVKIVGTAKSKINPDQISELISEFEKVDYGTFRGDYGTSHGYRRSKHCPEKWTDMPTTYTSFRSNGKTKKVAHYHGCIGTDRLKALTTLENKIDEIVNTNQWIK